MRPFADTQEMSQTAMSQETGNVKCLMLHFTVVLKPSGWEINESNYGHLNKERPLIAVFSLPCSKVLSEDLSAKSDKR